MGLFDKKECDICGGKIGLLGNRKLDNGNMCKECAKKLSPWFEERRHSTVDDIKEQLAYREENKQKVREFQITEEYASNNYHVFVDNNKGQFAIGRTMDVEENPDIVALSQITSCRLDVKSNQTEEKFRDNEGQMKSYNPPRYKYSYDYTIQIRVNSKWFDDMDFKLNVFNVEEHDRGKVMEMESMGNQIVNALMNNRGQQMNGMQGNAYATQQPIRCGSCGWTSSDPTITPKFCPECGSPLGSNNY